MGWTFYNSNGQLLQKGADSITSGSTDNAILRADGTGGSSSQGSGISINDCNHLLDVGNASSEWTDGILYIARTAAPRIDFEGHGADANPILIRFNKSRHASLGSHTTLSSGDEIFDIQAKGSDGDSFELGASIKAVTTEAWDASGRGTKLVFSTTANCSTSTAARITIAESGELLGQNGSASAPSYSFVSDTNTGIYRVCADVIGFTTGGTQRLRLSGGNLQACTGEFMLNEDTNSVMTQGITINHSANDNESLSLKNSDVTHTATCVTEADTYGHFQKIHPCEGGLQIKGYGACIQYGLFLVGTSNDEASAKNTSANGKITVRASCITSNDHAAVAANGNLMIIRDNTTTRFVFDEDGDGFADVQWAEYDDYCDVELLRGVHGALVPGFQERFGQDMLYNLERYEDLKLVGKDSVHWEKSKIDGEPKLRGMVNYVGMMKLHHSTIIQIYDRFNARLESIENRLALAEGKNGNHV